MRKIIPYNPDLVPIAKKLRDNMTFGEIALWREINKKKLGVRFSRQIPIDNYIVDFYCKDLRLAIEVDGSIHFEKDQMIKDARRQSRLESFGIKLIRFSDLDVKNNLSWVLEEIKNGISELIPTPNPSKEGNKTTSDTFQEDIEQDKQLPCNDGNKTTSDTFQEDIQEDKQLPFEEGNKTASNTFQEDFETDKQLPTRVGNKTTPNTFQEDIETDKQLPSREGNKRGGS